jgi:hypothetical protein
MNADRNNTNYLRKLEGELRKLIKATHQIWNTYKDAKHGYFQYQAIYLEHRGTIEARTQVVFLILLLIVVYLFDLLFSWQVIEYIAKQQLQNWWAIHLATLVFPLGWVIIEAVVNHFTHTAKQDSELYPRDRSRKRNWIFWLVMSVCLSMVMPLLYLATAFNTMTNTVFTILAIGITLMAAIVHIIVIFSGSNMAIAKTDLIAWWQNRRKFRYFQQQYRQLTSVKTEIEGLYTDYLRYALDHNYPPMPLPALVQYIITYVDRDYHHLTPEEVPPFDRNYSPRLGDDR